MALTITLNGQPREFQDLFPGATIADVVSSLSLKDDRIAIEHNGEITARNSWTSEQLNQADRLEVVHFVGGGS